MERTASTNATRSVLCPTSVTDLLDIAMGVVNKDGQETCVIKNAMQGYMVKTVRINAALTVM